jgi:hypothetical protein
MSKKLKSEVHVPVEPIRFFADDTRNWSAPIPPLKRGSYVIESTAMLSMPGDAPKSFLRVREYTSNRPTRRVDRWVPYIAKVGSKWYPVESVTEQLLTRVGQGLGANVADSQLRMVGTQVRFLSKYFLHRGETLTHGIEIFKSHLDESMVEEIAASRLEQEFYSFQTVEAAVKEKFPSECPSIMRGLAEMIAFDAIVGHNDRHPANWGVITPFKANKQARFSPIYDTARALLWNTSEKKLASMRSNRNQFEAYVRRSQPQIGWDGWPGPDHFQIVSLMLMDYPHLRHCIEPFCDPRLIENCCEMVEDELGELLSDNRRYLICSLLRLRHKQFRKAVLG